MLRTPHMKTCVNQLRLVLTLRDTPMQRERPVCSRSALGRRLSQGEDVTHPHSCGLLSTPRTVLDASEWIPLCIRAHFLLTHMHFNWAQKPNAFLRFAHMSLNTSPSQCPSFPESRVKKSQNSPESSNKTQTCDCVYERGTGRPLSLHWRSTLALQTRGLHTEAEQRPLVDGCLSAENEARCRGSLRPNAALYEREKSWAAVLVCLCAVSGRPALLFTLRSAKLKGRHKGDVSFAGGKKDASDRTVVDTALREAREELGIHVTEDRVWGVLKPLRDMSGMMIAPVIANLGPLEALSFRPNPSEVEEIFTLTLEHLCQPQNRGYTHFRTGDRYGYTLPVFHSPKHRVWGLTAVAMDHTLKLIVPPEQLLDQRLAQ